MNTLIRPQQQQKQKEAKRKWRQVGIVVVGGGGCGLYCLIAVWNIISLHDAFTSSFPSSKVVLPVTDVEYDYDLIQPVLLENNNDTAMTNFLRNVDMIQKQQQEQVNARNVTTVIHYNGFSEVSVLTKKWFTWGGNNFCSKIHETRKELNDPNRFIIVNITFGCQDLFINGHVGTGNYLAFFYGIRLSAHVMGNIDLYITCDDAEVTKRELILPWIMGYFPARLAHQKSQYKVTNKTACEDFRYLPLANMYKEIRHDLRRMAIALVGTNTRTRTRTRTTSVLPFQNSILLLPSPQPNDLPLYTSSEFQLDDATIHFRCGDFLSDEWDHIETSTYYCYAKHISKNARTIGILTQPLEVPTGDQQRRNDDVQEKILNRCKVLVYSFIAYIQYHYPKVQIRIHNSMNETIALTYARMIMTSQSITGMTSFGEIATVASFGSGYIRHPSQWMKQIDEKVDDITLYKPHRNVPFRYIKDLWNENGTQDVLRWFWYGVEPNDGNYCGEYRDICAKQ